ncbi:unnamed protein product [Orchesella dallaii]|uniref:Peroxisomal membrane protein 11B n=1 Tax=Orchesella dallaii TaxID=48710 RepID=A0ABP1PJM8_9HEXA
MGKMDEFIKFNNQTAGRDKVFRLAQYTSRILWYGLAKRKSCAKSAEKAKRLDESLGLMRRLLRFGRFFETLHSALPVMSSVSDPVVRTTCVLSRISSTCFMLIDHIVCLDKLGVLPPKLINAAKWDRTSTRFWLYSIVLGLIRDFYEIQRIYREEFQHVRSRRVTKSSSSNTLTDSRLPEQSHHYHHQKRAILGSLGCGSVKMVECLKQARVFRRCVRDHGDVAVDLLKNSCDVFLPLNSLGFVNLSPAVIGLLGVISTIASALPQINPMIKMVPAT